MMTKSTGVHECLQPGLKNSGTDGRKHWMLNTLRPRQNGCYFPDIIFKCMFLNENVWIPIKISLKFALKGPINNILALVQIMVWRHPGDKPLSEPVLVCLLTHICVYRPQWVKCFGGDKGVVSSMVMCLFSANQCGCSDPLTSINVAAQIPWHQSMWLLRSPDINQCGCSDPLTSINVAAQIPWHQSMWLLRSPDINQCGCSDPLTSINVAAQIPWHQSMWLLRSPDINQCGCSDPLTSINVAAQIPWHQSMWLLRSPDISLFDWGSTGSSSLCINDDAYMRHYRGKWVNKGFVSSMVVCLFSANQCGCSDPLTSINVADPQTSINVAAQIPRHQSMWLLISPDINQCGCSYTLTSIMWLLRSPDINQCGCSDPWHQSMWLLRSPDINQCGCSDPLTSINVAAQIPWHQSMWLLPWHQSMWLLRSLTSMWLLTFPDINVAAHIPGHQCGCSHPLTSINVAAQIPWHQSLWLLRSPDINQCGCSDPLTSIIVAAQIPWHQSMWLLRSPDMSLFDWGTLDHSWVLAAWTNTICTHMVTWAVFC